MVFTEGLGAMGGIQRKLGCKFNKLFSGFGVTFGALFFVVPIIVYFVMRSKEKSDNDKKNESRAGGPLPTKVVDSVNDLWPSFVAPMVIGLVIIGMSFFKYYYRKEKCSIYSTMTDKQLRAGDTVRAGSTLAYGLINTVGAAAGTSSNNN